jgi:hypothetical protein
MRVSMRLVTYNWYRYNIDPSYHLKNYILKVSRSFYFSYTLQNNNLPGHKDCSTPSGRQQVGAGQVSKSGPPVFIFIAGGGLVHIYAYPFNAERRKLLRFG